MATIKVSKEMEEMAVAGKKAGMPVDQVRSFITSGYIPLEGMLPFHAACREADKPGGPEWIALGGKRGPGKSHTIMSQVGLDDCARVPGLKWLFLRKIKASAKESLEDVILRVFMYTPHSSDAGGVELPNGSRIVIGGYKDENDIDKYLGIQYDGIVIEECTQLGEGKVTKLRGSLRTSNPAWRPRIYLSTNADGIGLAWFKKMFIEPWRKGVEKLTRFFDVTKIKNPFINIEYEQWLDTLTGALGKAWRDGDWDAFAGMAFPMWNHTIHVVPSFDIPLDWFRWRAVDEGSAAPFCCLWAARDPNSRRIYIYREAYQADLTLTQQAQLINDMSQPGEKFAFTYADPAMWQKKNRKNEVYSAADEYKDNGIILTRADNDRIQGKRKVDQALSYAPDGEPGVMIFDYCTHLIEQLSTLARDKLRPEDVDTTQEDHAYDTFRYIMTNERKTQGQPPKPAPAFIHPLAGVKGI